MISEQGIKGAQLPYALNSVKGVLDNIEKIDIDISSNLKGWTIDRLTKTALTILRLGIFEAFYNEEKDFPFLNDLIMEYNNSMDILVNKGILKEKELKKTKKLINKK